MFIPFNPVVHNWGQDLDMKLGLVSCLGPNLYSGLVFSVLQF